nr:MAG TPA: hypothetical protein [Caudoviricetes sp.]
MVSFLAGFRKGRVVRLPYALHYTYGYRKVQGGKVAGIENKHPLSDCIFEYCVVQF